MNAYRSESSYHRPIFALAAAALAVASLALAVVAPAHQEPGIAGTATARLGTIDGVPPAAVMIFPARVDVIAPRVRETAMEAAPTAHPGRAS